MNTAPKGKFILQPAIYEKYFLSTFPVKMPRLSTSYSYGYPFFDFVWKTL